VGFGSETVGSVGFLVLGQQGSSDQGYLDSFGKLFLKKIIIGSILIKKQISA
jgi:hypothetical protein